MPVEKFATTLNAELKEKALKELNEKDDWRDRDIQALRERVVNNKALTCSTESAFLIRFLRARKFDYERSYKLLENYFKIRAEHIEHFRDLKPSALTHVWEAGVTQVLPKPDKHGRRIIYFRPGKWDPSKYPVYELLKANTINFELLIRDEATQVHGVVFVGNAEGTSFEHVRNLSRDYFKLTSSLLQEATPLRLKAIHMVHEHTAVHYVLDMIKFFMSEKLQKRESFPLRLKAFHMINEAAIIGALFPLIKPFLKEKLQNRMNFHGHHVENLLKEETGLTKEVLPAELGGELPHGDELAKQWATEVLKHDALFEEMQKHKIVLPRAIASPANTAQATGAVSGVQGVTGTFKKLNVD